MSAPVIDRRLHGMVAFDLPADLEATEPPEARGIRRDAVRLMVARSTEPLVHTTAAELPRYLEPGDLVVINTSGTLPAAVPGTLADGTDVVVHLSTEQPGGLWTLELRRGERPWLAATAPTVVHLPAGASATLLAPLAPHPDGVRLWYARLDLPSPLRAYLAVHGRPIRYRYVTRAWSLDHYQNVYATEPGSAEMPSAGRPFTPELVTRLVARGIGVSPLVLHTGVASLEPGEPPYPEPFRVPAETARRVNDTRASGHRVVAIGTTVVRALETAADDDGVVRAAHGWTDLVITPERGVRVVGGLLTGWHEPEASHLSMLEAVAGRALVARSYDAALAERYLWHEFGDVHLLLP